MESVVTGVRRVVKNEPVLWIRALEAEGKAASTRLLFSPQRILGMRSTSGLVEYPVEKIRIESGNQLWTDWPVPALDESELFPREAGACTIERHCDGRRLIHFSEGHYFHNLQVCVDYETEESWRGPMPACQSEYLPRMAARLQTGEPLRLAVLGDSISTGANASGKTDVAPHQPGYVDLFVGGLQRAGHAVTAENFSVGGKTAAWGAENSQVDAVAGFVPDVLILAFGMNDASGGVKPDEFEKTISGIIQRIRRSCRDTECILISGMSAHEAWHLARPDLHAAYGDVLRRLAASSQGVVCCDVRAVWNFIVGRKGFWSMTGNGVNHPNDFGHRLYATCLLATVGWVFR